MILCRRPLSRGVPWAVALVGFAICAPSARGIQLSLLDDFQDGTTQNWGVSSGGSLPVANAENEGPAGFGDHALFMDSTQFGAGGRLLVLNANQWTGDWTSAQITRVTLDVRNPNDYDLTMRLGIAGEGGSASMNFGDVHVTTAGVVVPGDNEWHSIAFSVLASDFTTLDQSDAATALGNVTQFRILHNPAESFIGEMVAGGFYLDNIRAVPEPAGWLLLAGLGLALGPRRRSR
jgi:hypothetical protein